MGEHGAFVGMDEIGVIEAASLLAGQGGAPSVLLLRVLARRMEAARAVLHEGWRLLRPALLNQQARPPRLWAT